MRGRDARYISANMCEYSDYTRTMIGAGRGDALSWGDKAAARELERALSVAFGDGRPATGWYV
jgi:hypothetical protein